MPSAIDHLVIAVPDPDAAARELEAALGIAFTSGGRHPGAGTFNRVAFLGEPYLELIGIEDEELAAGGPIGAAALRTLRKHPEGGLATFALLSRKLEKRVARLRKAGSPIQPPAPGARRAPDGEMVEWVTATFDRLGPSRPPFLIRHVATGSEWSPDAIQRRWTARQPAGCVTTLAMLQLAAKSPAGVARHYRRQLGLKVEALGDDRYLDIGAQSVLLVPRKPGEPRVAVHLACPARPDVVVQRFGIRWERRSPTS